jgi:hypothetical protein
MHDCTKKAIGYFLEEINVGNFSGARVSIPGGEVCWCDEHESVLFPRTVNKVGVYKQV